MTATITAAQLVAYMAGPPHLRPAVLEQGIDPFAPARALACELMFGRVDGQTLAKRAQGLRGAEQLLSLGEAWARTSCPHRVELVTRSPVLTVEGLQVTDAAPDVLLLGPGPRGLTRMGGLWLTFEPVSERQAWIRVALMCRAVERMAWPRSYTGGPDACAVVDLGAGRTWRGGAAAWGGIESACREIRRRR